MGCGATSGHTNVKMIEDNHNIVTKTAQSEVESPKSPSRKKGKHTTSTNSIPTQQKIKASIRS